MNRHLIYLTFAAMVALTGAVSAGTYSGGSGTEADPYRIATAADMNEIGANPDDWGSHFVMVNDINLADYTGMQFNIIGSEATPFTGVFDGNGHTISNFTYETTDEDNIGLFGCVSGANAMIKDLILVAPDVNAAGNSRCVASLVGHLQSGTITGCGIDGGSISGRGEVGGLVGCNDDGTISNCYAAGNVTGFDCAGGLVGANYEGTVSNCYAAGSVSGGIYTGGLAGKNQYGAISDCCAKGRVLGTFTHTGGFVGDNNYGTIENCYTIGSVTGKLDVGGLVGGNYGTISNCHARGSVMGGDDTGGLVGYNSSDTISSCYSTGNVTGYSNTGGLVGANCDGTISNSYVSGSVTGYDNTGGFVGHNCCGPISNCYATGSVTGYDNIGGLVGVNGGPISNCYANGSVAGYYEDAGGLVGVNYKSGAISNCYAAGRVTGYYEPPGGLVGDNYEGTVSASFWDIEIGGPDNGIGTGLPTSQMQTEGTFTDAGWDFTTPIWTIDEGNDYPRLWWEECQEPVEAQLWVFPRVIVRHSKQKNILVWIRLPEGVEKEQVSDEPLLLYPGEIEAVNQYVIEHGRADNKRTSVLAFFEKAELMGAVVDNGEVEVEAVGSLTSGRYFYGSDTVLIKGRPNTPPRRWRFN